MRSIAAVALIALFGQANASPSTAVRKPLVYSQLRQPQQDRTSVKAQVFDFFKKSSAPASPSNVDLSNPGKISKSMYKNTAYKIQGKTQLPVPKPDQAEQDEQNVLLKFAFGAKRSSVTQDVNTDFPGAEDELPSTYKNTAYRIQGQSGGKTMLPEAKAKQAKEDEENWLLKFAFGAKRAAVTADVKAEMNKVGGTRSLGLAQTPSGFLGLSAALLFGFFAGGSITFAVCRSRRGDLTMDEMYSSM